MIRPEVNELLQIGPFPPSHRAVPATVKRQQELMRLITPPISDAEARELLKLFGPDDYFGLAWTLLHLVEGAPHWPLPDCLTGTNEWITRLRDRVARRAE